METASTSTLTIQAIAAYLQNPAAKTYRADVDQQLWETLQSILSSQQGLLKEFEQNPSKERLQGKIEQAMDDALNHQPAARQTFETLLKQREAKDSTGGTQISNGKNIVAGSQFHAGGNIQVGDVTNG